MVQRDIGRKRHQRKPGERNRRAKEPLKGGRPAKSRSIKESAQNQLIRSAVHARLRAEVAAILTEQRLSIQHTLQRCAESLMHHLPAAFARIWTLNVATQTLELEASAGMYTHLDGAHSRVPVGKFKIGLIAQEAKAHLTNDVLHDRRISDPEWARREGMVAFAGYPLQADGQVLGVMALFAKEALPKDTLEALASVADLLSQGLERKRAEDALHESSERFQTLADNIAPLAWMANPDGSIFWYNKRWFDYTGTTLEEMQGWGWEKVHHPDHIDRVTEKWRTHLQAGEAWEDTFPLRRQDGQYGWFLSRARPIRDPQGKIVRWFGTNTDVTELRETEERLRGTQCQLEADLESMRAMHGVATRFAGAGDFQRLLQDIVDAAISITHAEKGNVQLFDQATQSLRIIAQRGFSAAWVEFFDQISTERSAACTAAMSQGKRVIVEDVIASPIFLGTPALEVQRREGVRAVQSTPIIGRSGELLGMLSTHYGAPHRPSERELQYVDLLARQAADFLEEHRAQQALAAANASLRQHAQELERRVEERTASLNESLKSFETLLYTIAHDLRAPNRAMQGYAQLLAEGYAEKLDDDGRMYLKRISTAAIKNERLIRDLLEFGRLAHVEFPCHGLDPKPVIEAVVTGLEREIQASKATIHVAEVWPEVWGNDSALGHAVTNLVSNALKYVATGVAPRIEIYPKPASDSTHPGTSGWVRLCVEDNGIGVAADQRERIFEPFQRASTESYEGTGMGLAIVRKAAERMGGRAGVDSEPRKGSCFWIELLLASSKQEGKS